MKKKKKYIAILIFVIGLAIHIPIMNQYGLTWDFHHHFYAGMKFLGQPLGPELTNLPFTNPDPRITSDLPFGPIMSTMPVFTYITFFDNLHLLNFDNAYNLAIVLVGVVGLVILYLFLSEATNGTTAALAAVFLALLPRYFGDLHNNMKDVPQAVAFTLAIWMMWRLVNYRKAHDLLLASLSFALAFNIKVNSLAVPIVACLWWIWLFITGATTKLVRPFRTTSIKIWVKILCYLILAPALAFVIWSLFWPNPIDRLLYIPKFFQINTQNIEVLYFGKWYCSSVNVPWHYPLGYLAITTPLPILAFWFIGIVVLAKRLIRRDPLASLLLLWFFVPMARYAYPKMGVIDGVRHFEEVVFPLAAIAGIGAYTILNLVKKKLTRMIITGVAIAILIGEIIISHPFQITYFNQLVGGTSGAFGQFDLDYWGSSQKQAIKWINENAPLNANIHIVMSSDVAAKYLRPDLLARVNTAYFDNADYVVFLNRQSFFYRYSASGYLLTHKPIYAVTTNGVPLVWIFDARTPTTAQQTPWWKGSSPCIKY